MTKSEARKKLDGILNELGERGEPVSNNMSLEQLIDGVYYPFYKRKWKRSTAGNNINRVNTHVVAEFGSRKVTEFRRDELQTFLDGKGAVLSFSMVDHLSMGSQPDLCNGCFGRSDSQESSGAVVHTERGKVGRAARDDN